MLKRERTGFEDALSVQGTPSKDRQKLMREEEILKEIFNTLKVCVVRVKSSFPACMYLLLS